MDTPEHMIHFNGTGSWGRELGLSSAHLYNELSRGVHRALGFLLKNLLFFDSETDTKPR